MKIRCTLALSVALALAGGASAQEDAKKEQAKLQGKWQITKMEVENKEFPPEDLAKLKISIEADKFITTKDDGEQEKNSFKLDPAKKPQTIDVTPLGGPLEGQVLQGIYALEGETLKMCLALPGGTRPDAFTAGEQRVFLTLKRVK
jgi:uncharacterized protein (TIGR03067 family)